MKVSDRPSEKVINVRFFATTGGSQRRATRPLIFALFVSPRCDIIIL